MFFCVFRVVFRGPGDEKKNLKQMSPNFFAMKNKKKNNIMTKLMLPMVDTTIIPPGNTRHTTSELACRTKGTIFGAKLEACFLQSDNVLGTINPF